MNNKEVKNIALPILILWNTLAPLSLVFFDTPTDYHINLSYKTQKEFRPIINGKYHKDEFPQDTESQSPLRAYNPNSSVFVAVSGSPNLTTTQTTPGYALVQEYQELRLRPNVEFQKSNYSYPTVITFINFDSNKKG